MFLYINPFLNKLWFSHVCNTTLLKTLWEKEKLLITSNFSFSHSVFYQFGELSAIFIKYEIVVCKLFQFGRVQKLSFGKGLTGRISRTDLSEPYSELKKRGLNSLPLDKTIEVSEFKVF